MSSLNSDTTGYKLFLDQYVILGAICIICVLFTHMKTC